MRKRTGSATKVPITRPSEEVIRPSYFQWFNIVLHCLSVCLYLGHLIYPSSLVYILFITHRGISIVAILANYSYYIYRHDNCSIIYLTLVTIRPSKTLVVDSDPDCLFYSIHIVDDRHLPAVSAASCINASAFLQQPSVIAFIYMRAYIYIE